MIARVPQPTLPKLILSSRLGLVSIPAGIAQEGLGDGAQGGNRFGRDEARALLRSLGRSLGLDVLETGSDPLRASTVSADAFPEDAVRLALEGLDAVWMDGAAPVAAFVLEPGDGGWEGLRRLADLLALYPKLKAPLYAVTAPDLRPGIEAEVHRPAYRLLKNPLSESLRLLDWTRLEAEVGQLGERVRYLKPEFLEGIADRLAPPAEA